MYLSKVEFVRSRWQRMVEVLSQVDKNLFYEHQMIWDLLPQDATAKRDFMYRRTDEGDLPFYYLLSEREPEVKVDYLSCSSRLYEPKLETGDSLQFSLRANAVKTLWHPKEIKQRKRVGLLKSDELHDWLLAQGEKGGFQLQSESLVVENTQIHEVIKPDDPNCRTFTSVDLQGKLQVTDAEVFTREVLFKGLGRSKAFGCGLLLVRRV
ncbi:type I-E CRISPR-associated protein Cas6/Cse3/CasE [Thiothrix sp.]|jgi:CRISPR system Cascade subunit CasE|uniref:type I-E CRISPR-associated protein Cas6/Cse3/CasE n=1 Tax=Thiothrix sp. TaxID=1032 RepID=UPI002580580E|nr:type I-E CRISPR-associated protein Cas6/Cse3/CasE [Thiothrix sp.]